MGNEARRAFIGATDNSTKETPPNTTVKPKEGLKKDTSGKKPLTWDDILNK